MDAVNRLKPDIVACGMMTGDAKHYIQALNHIKRLHPEITTIAGGVHPTFYPEVIQEHGIDALVIGEGDRAFADLLIAIENKQDYSTIPNILTKQFLDNYTNIRPLMPDLDALPHPDYDLVYNQTDLGKSTMKVFMTSRGCPMRCTYCFNDQYRDMYKEHGNWGKIRRNSVDYIVEGIQRIRHKYPMNFIKFYDDIFLTKADDWAYEFAVKYYKEIGLPFYCFERADMLTEDMVKCLKWAGCHTIGMSIESGNNRVRSEMMNRHMDNDKIIKSFELCGKYDIKTFTNVIYGIPDTTLQEEIDSLDLAIKCKVDWLEPTIFQPYPGTWLGEYTAEQGYFNTSADIHSDYHYQSELSCFDESRKTQQLALVTQGTIVALFPILYKWFIKFGINHKPNRFWYFIYWLIKMRKVRRVLYPSKLKGWDSIKVYWQSWKQEVYKRKK